ncbi:IS3 family transposase [Meridianimarinicoccus sp. RP-17]|uniref:IS3 family transposase n=1 Tax=Meridianimarinicoccus zhengii TaxID=2056810 RepID=UPI0013A7090D
MRAFGSLIRDITNAFEGYGYRRVGAELRHRGFIVNSKKVRGSMPLRKQTRRMCQR